jgi:hypothetical protein
MALRVTFQDTGLEGVSHPRPGKHGVRDGGDTALYLDRSEKLQNFSQSTEFNCFWKIRAKFYTNSYPNPGIAFDRKNNPFILYDMHLIPPIVQLALIMH